MNGLQEEYSNQIDIISLNAMDGAEGQAAFEFYGLRGHPGLVLVGPDGQVTWSLVGAISREELVEVLNQALSP